MAVTRRAIPAAAGYPQYSGNLIHPMFGQELIERFYQTSIFGEITSTDYLGELQARGDQITFWREPTVIVRNSIKDGTIQHDTLESEPVTMVIDKAKEFSVKISKIDEKQMQQWDVFKAAMLKNASRAMANIIDQEILGTIYADVAPSNAGVNAGLVSQSYNLGTVGNPVPVTSANITEVLVALHCVLNEAAVPREDRWVIIPSVGENVALNSDLRRANMMGMSESIILNGRIPGTIAGFNVYVSDHVPRVYDLATNTWCHHIIAGHKRAVCFASQLEETRIIEDKDNWDTFYQGLSVYGFGVMLNQSLAHLYARFA